MPITGERGAARGLRAGIAAACALALGFSAAPVQAQDEWVDLSPSSDWVLDYAEDSCALRRNFGEPGQAALLEMRQFSPFTPMRITVATSDFEATRRAPRYRFGTGQDFERYDLPAFGSYGEGGNAASFYGNLIVGGVTSQEGPDTTAKLRELQAEAWAGLADLYLRESFAENLLLRTGDLGPVMKAMRECMDNLVAEWGATSYFEQPPTVPPEALRMERWAKPIVARFPRNLLREREPAIVRVRLLIDETGKVNACMVQEPVVDAEYEAFVCDIMLNEAMYNPAHDGEGSPLASFYVLTVVYDPN